MANYNEAFELVISHEGGYVNDPLDPGKETNFGISKKYYPNLDIKNLTREKVKKIYYEDYWKPLNLDDFPQILANEVFDYGSNTGIYRAAVAAQMAYNLICDSLINDERKLIVDGIIGPVTMHHLQKLWNSGWARAILTVYRAIEVDYYLSLPEKLKRRFLKGWLTRV